VSKSIQRAQSKVEAHNYEIRKHVLEYDDVMNKQRSVIYADRRANLEAKFDSRTFMRRRSRARSTKPSKKRAGERAPSEWDLEEMVNRARTRLPIKTQLDRRLI